MINMNLICERIPQYQLSTVITWNIFYPMVTLSLMNLSVVRPNAVSHNGRTLNKSFIHIIKKKTIFIKNLKKYTLSKI